MTGRRTFLASLGAAGVVPARPRGAKAPRVEAAPSVFHAHPAAERTLVRFRAFDVDAPAGRMRIIGSRGELLGTAGVIRRGDHLYGESWLLTNSIERFTTQLETPGLRNPIRNSHRLDPKPRWTIHWITVADPFEVEEFLRSLPPEMLGTALQVLHRSMVMTNPLAVGTSWASADHLDAFRSSTGARNVERTWGIPASPVAIADRRLFDLNAAPMILAGNGVTFAFTPGLGSGTPFEIMESRDGSRVALAETAGGSEAAELGFGADRDAMAAAIERWLETGPTLVAPAELPHTAVVISTGVESNRGVQLARVEEWNGRFAYPRIVMGGIEEIIARTVNLPAANSSSTIRGPRPPTEDQLRTATLERRTALTARVDQVIDPLRQLVGAAEYGVQGWLTRARFPFDGHVVFNPSPFPRSDYVTYPDGREVLATNVPAIGYAYTPSVPDGGTQSPPVTGVMTLSGQRFDLEVDRFTGAIASVTERETGTQWCHPESGGLNHVPGARIDETVYTEFPGGARRLAFARRSSVGRIHTTITMYADNTWIDITNHTESERVPVDYHFAFAGPTESVAWETPGGYERDNLPFGGRAHLRWIAAEGPAGRGLLRGLDAPWFRTQRDGDALRIVSLTTGGRNRYRIDAAGPFASPDLAWRFGWDAEPLVVYPVDTSGTVDVSTFGRVVRTDPLTVVAGIRMADEGFGLVVYLQNPMDFSRAATLERSLVEFETARRVDFVERDLGEVYDVADGQTQVMLPPHGVVAVRLSGLTLRGG